MNTRHSATFQWRIFPDRIKEHSGEDTPSGMADWVKYRAEHFIGLLDLKRQQMPHHSTYRRIEAEVVDPEELEQDHTQRGVSIQIVEAGGNYLWFAKGNQPQLEEDIRLWFEPEPDPMPGQGRLPKDFETVKETSKGHGRLEERTLTVSSQLNDFLDWPFVQQIFRLDRRFVCTKTGEIQEQVVYGFTSLSRELITQVRLLKKIRSY